MAMPHAQSSGMGGIRTAGDLVARMQFAKNMHINEAKEHVAKTLDLTPLDLRDEEVMREKRQDLDIGVVTGLPGAPRGIAAKMNIEKLLGLKINSCEHFRQQLREAY